MISKIVNKVYPLLLSESRRKQFEKIVFIVAIITFIIHFLLIILTTSNILPGFENSVSALSPISAIYTPFSIILIYEIYLLIYYLPMSITIYLGKQYEIIAIILIRKIFDNLSKLTIGVEPLDFDVIINLLYMFGGLILLCLLIFLFYKLSGNKKPESIDERKCKDIKSRKFIIIKKIMAIVLMLIFIFLFVISLLEFKNINSFINMDNLVAVINAMNNSFFDTFFTALIITEVLLLLFTFNLSDKFSKVIRNSGFIVSTILLKLSFKTMGIANIVIILVAVGFGVSILAVHKLFEKKL